MKILVVGGNNEYASWINTEKYFLESKIEEVRNAELVMFTGGEDVDPSIYGFGKNSKTHCNIKRDLLERAFYNEARNLGIPMVAICRGCQLITALQPSGVLIQHVTGHAIGGMHEIQFADGDVALATSTHHQMMYPFNVGGHQIIAWASRSLSDGYELDDNTKLEKMPNNKEPEIVYYPKTRCLAIQLHPEYMDKSSRVVYKLNELLNQKFGL